MREGYINQVGELHPGKQDVRVRHTLERENTRPHYGLGAAQAGRARALLHFALSLHV